jgi:hypothetical protein
MAGHDSVFRAGGGHTDHFLCTEVGREKGEPRHPGGNQAARQKEIGARTHVALEHESDSKDEGEVNNQDRAINQFQPNRLHPWSILSAKSLVVSLNLRGLVVAVS